MEIKRTFEMMMVVNRRYIVRQVASNRPTVCAECGEPVLTAEQTAGFFGIKQRRIFQLIETDAAHYIETEAGAVMICLPSPAAVLDDGKRDDRIVRA